MPRKSRIDATRALHHVMVRGIERGMVFRNDADRDQFLERLEEILQDAKTLCYAWALIPNHSACPFSHCLLTGNWRLKVSNPSGSNRSSEDKAMIRVISVEAMEGKKLRVQLSNGKRGMFDVSPYLDKGVFHELRDPQYFRLVRVAFGGITWPHEQDFSADTIEYDLEEESPNTRLHEDRSLPRGL